MSQPPIPNGPEQRYLRRGANLRVRKVQRARWLLGLLMMAAFQISVAAALVLGVRGAVDYVTRADEFAVRHIRLDGVNRASEDAIREGLDGYRGRNLLELDLRAIESDVERDPWVLRAAVRRSLPDSLHVRVTERVPTALAVIRGQVHLVDSTGYVIGPTGASAADNLPVLTGLDGFEGDALRAALETGVRALGDLSRTSPAFVRDLSELDLSGSDRLVAHLTQGGPALLLDPSHVERNLLSFLELREEIARHVAAVEYADLRWRDRISVMPSKPTEQGGTR